MSWITSNFGDARRKAEEKFADMKDRKSKSAKQQSKTPPTLNDKIERLRALRLAKEAEDRAAAEENAAAKKRRPKGKRASE